MRTAFRWQSASRATSDRSWIDAVRAKAVQSAIIGSEARRPSAIALFSSTV